MKFKIGDIVVSNNGKKVGKIIDSHVKAINDFKWEVCKVKLLNNEEKEFHVDLLQLIDEVIKEKVEQLDKLEDQKEKALLL